MKKNEKKLDILGNFVYDNHSETKQKQYENHKERRCDIRYESNNDTIRRTTRVLFMGSIIYVYVIYDRKERIDNA